MHLLVVCDWFIQGVRHYACAVCFPIPLHVEELLSPDISNEVGAVWWCSSSRIGRRLSLCIVRNVRNIRHGVRVLAVGLI